MKRRFLNSTAFSLIELLVAVAVIAVLAALVVTASVRMRDNANNVKCVANLKSIGQALQLYITEHGYYPGAVPAPEKTWYGVLGVYLGDSDPENAPSEVFRCPSRGYSDGSLVGYGYNYGGFGFSENSTGGAPLPPEELPPKAWRIRPVEVRYAMNKLVIGDSIDLHLNLGPTPNKFFYMNPAFWSTRHRGAGNYLFADGHVAPATPQQLIDANDLPDWEANNPFNP